jgi:RNA recognition motif-containing protein
MSMKLFVGNLPHEMTEGQLNTLFSEAGAVS